MSTGPFDKTPIRSETHELDTRGMKALGAVLTDPLFIIHEHSRHDYGVDITAEALHEGAPLNFRTHLQLKSRNIEPNSDGSFSVSVPLSNLTHLLGQPLSAYVLFHAPSERLFLKFAIDAVEEHRAAGRAWSGDSFTVRFTDEFSGRILANFHNAIVRHGLASRTARFPQPGHEAVVSQMEALARGVEARSGSGSLLSLLVREASRHFERALDHERLESYVLAIQSLSDVTALLKESGADPRLLLRATALRGGIEAVAGRVEDAIVSGTTAVNMVPNGPLDQLGAWAHGNLGMALYSAGRAPEALPHFQKVLQFNKRAGDRYETMLTLQHLVECTTMIGHLSVAMNLGVEMWREREEYSTTIPSGHVTEPLMGVLGTLANLYFEVGRTDHPLAGDFLKRSAKMHEEVFRVARDTGMTRLRFSAQMQLAVALWHLDRLEEAEAHFLEVSSGAPLDIAGAKARAAFNLGLVRSELGRIEGAIQALQQARTLFTDLGDASNAADCDTAIDKILRS